MKCPKLPDTPNKLIRLALEDLKKAEESKDYIVDMNDWHVPREVCEVCLAGAMIAFSLRANPKERCTPCHFPEDCARKLHALEDFRIGRVWMGLTEFYDAPINSTEYPDVPVTYPVIIYKEDREGFFTSMYEMADMLEEKGY